MRIFEKRDLINGIGPTAVALGFFDGVHLGHRVILKRCLSYAKERGLAPAVFTFRDHPRNVLSGTNKIKRLLSYEARNELLGAMGFEYVFAFDFAEGFHEMSPEAFVSDLLADSFGAAAVFCGYNFHFGARARGDAASLIAMGKTQGFEAFVTDPVVVDDADVSSTRIRTLISKGKVEEANSLLGTDFSLGGTVMHGNATGRTIGFPTANFEPDPAMVFPSNGVYATEVKLEGGDKAMPAVTNIGIKPTVGGTKLLVETYIFGFEGDIYGKHIDVSFLRHLRKEQTFDGLESLKRQIAEDKASAEAYFLGK